MKQLTYKEIILKTLQESGGWIKSYDLEKIQTKYGWLGNSGDRRCRELYNEGKIQRKINGKYAEYKCLVPTSWIILKSKRDGSIIGKQAVYN